MAPAFLFLSILAVPLLRLSQLLPYTPAPVFPLSVSDSTPDITFQMPFPFSILYLIKGQRFLHFLHVRRYIFRHNMPYYYTLTACAALSAFQLGYFAVRCLGFSLSTSGYCKMYHLSDKLICCLFSKNPCANLEMNTGTNIANNTHIYSQVSIAQFCNLTGRISRINSGHCLGIFSLIKIFLFLCFYCRIQFPAEFSW